MRWCGYSGMHCALRRIEDLLNRIDIHLHVALEYRVYGFGATSRAILGQLNPLGYKSSHALDDVAGNIWWSLGGGSTGRVLGAAVVHVGRGLHSFTLWLNLSNSRTRS